MFRLTYLLFLASLCTSAYANISVVDFLGRTVKIEKPAQRIVALAPHIVENLYSAGVGDKIVGAVDYCDYPPSANKIPRVGAISTYSLESILELKPDLVIIWYSGRGGKTLEKLVQLGLTVYASDPRKLGDVPRSIRDYGKLGGTQATANKAASTYEKIHLRLKKKYENRLPVSTFYQVWNDPIQTLNGQHIISDVINLCGGVNSFSDAIPLAPKVSIESIIQVNPDIIVASGMGEARPDWLDMWKKWDDIKAVKLNNLFYIPPDLIQRHTTRQLDGAQMMCEFFEQARINIGQYEQNDKNTKSH